MTASSGIAATEPITFSDEVKQAFLERISEEAKDEMAGALTSHVEFMRELGVQGTKGQIRAAIKEQLGDDIRELRRARLANVVLGRAIHGEIREVRYQGQVVGEELVWDTKAQELAARMQGMLDDRLEVTGAGGGPIEIEGRAVVELGAVIALARQLGVGGSLGLDAGDPRGALPVAPDVLPDPPAR